MAPSKVNCSATYTRKDSDYYEKSTVITSGNSSGISALGGTTETYLSKNKGKTFEHKMRKMTVISGIIFAVLCIVFAIIAIL